jgi:hypothetical protein
MIDLYLSLYCANKTTINVMKYSEYEITIMETVKAFIERGDDGSYGVYVDLENTTLNYGIHGNGNTAKEAIDDFMSAYEAMKKFHAEKNVDFTEANFIFAYDMASFLSYYKGLLTLTGLGNLTGINPKQLNHYATGVRKPSKRTVDKIEKSLHEFADDLSQVNFV